VKQTLAATAGARTQARRDQSGVRWLLVGIDTVCIAIAILTAGAFRVAFTDVLDLNPADLGRLLYVSGLAFPLLLVVFRAHNLYDLERFPGGSKEYATVARAVTVSIFIGLGLSYFAGETFVSRSWLLVSWALCVVLVALGRFTARVILHRLRLRGTLRTRLLIVGASDYGVAAARRVSAPAEGYEVIGFLDDEIALGTRVDGDLTVVGRLADLGGDIRSFTDEIVVVPGVLSYEQLEALLPGRRLNLQGLPVRFADVSLPLTRRSHGTSFVKRSMDVTGAAVGLVMLSPFLVAIAIAIKFSSRGRVLYEWRVVGAGGRPFVGYKFRTMVANADTLKAQLMVSNEMRGPAFKMRQDPRTTRVGRFLRRYSLDELPQLWSVLKGDMSLVGPRPPFPKEFAAFRPDQREKLSVTPGMTCLWQISGRNHIDDVDEWVRLDLEYIRNWSLLLDLKILIRTVKVVITRHGAY